MTDYQKIAIGLLGLTHPEVFRRASRTHTDNTAATAGCAAPSSVKERMRHVVRVLRFTLAALGLGSRVVGLADNSHVIKDLSATARHLYGSG